MKTIFIQLNGKQIEVNKRYFIAISNNGNHTGHNRIWDFVDKCNTIKKAKQLCKYYGENLEELQSCTYFKYNELEKLFIENTIIGSYN